MAVRFIIGRAGSGKTYHCLHAIRTRLAQDPVNGARLILLVPEQAGLQMERAIVQPVDSGAAPSGVTAAHRAEVVSFKRLAHRVLDSSVGLATRALTEPARAMVLRHLVARHADDLQYYRRAARTGASAGRLAGFVERLGATIGELMEEAIEPGDLPALSPEMSTDDATHPTDVSDAPVHRAKFHDLRLIYQAYLDYLRDGRLDPSQYLRLARDHFPRCPWLVGAEVWIDGFASLSGEETLTLLSLARLARSLDITVMMDPAQAEARGAVARAPAVNRLFSRTRRTYQELCDRFVRAGLEIDAPLILGAAPPKRFALAPALQRLEVSVFQISDAPGDAPSREPATAAPRDAVELAELPTRRIEVEYAVSRVCHWVWERSPGYRYRDVAIIARDLEPYHDLLSQALAARGVPFFIDRRRPIAHHPLVEWLRAGTALAAGDMPPTGVRLLLKTGLLPLSLDEADELENYLLAHGVAGSSLWRGGDWAFRGRSSFVARVEAAQARDEAMLTRVNTARRIVSAALDPWLDFAAGESPKTGADWSAAMIEWLDHARVGATLRQWASAAEADGDLDGAEEHRQVWRETVSLLDDAAYALADVPLGNAEWADVLEAGLSGFTLGLAPPTVDQVLVGSIERSRHPDIKAAVIVGFNDGVFPARLTEDSILNDDDRDLMRDAGLRVRPARGERVFDEAALAYVALTRASESVVVTYAAADDDGRALRPSPYVEALQNAWPGLQATAIGDPTRMRDAWDVHSLTDLTGRLATEFRTRPSIESDGASPRALWNELYESFRGPLARGAAARRALASLDEREVGRLSAGMVERFFRGPLRTSVSRLEAFAACPFKHFAQYLLGLREREEAVLEAVDVGQIHHRILEDFVRTLAERRQGLGELSDAELLDGLRSSCATAATSLPTDGTRSDARNAYLLRRSAAELARMIRAQRRQSRSSSVRPRAAELSFGFDDPGGLPAFELSTPEGRRVFLRGYIDRVDLAEVGDEALGVVVDYKRTREKRLHLSSAYHGLSLQLLAYLLVLAEHGRTLAGRPIRPIGAVYHSLASQYHLVDHPDEEVDGANRERNQEGTFRPRGLLLADRFDALDPACDIGWSEHYAVYRKKDGSLGHADSSDAADAGSFRAMLDRVRAKLGEFADGVLDGDVGVRPYRLGTFSPCSWCPMTSVCRFEMGISEVRYLESLKRSEVFQRLTGTSDET